VKEFMEIQLMHANDVYLKFLDWFDTAFPTYDPLDTPREMEERPESGREKSVSSRNSATMSLHQRREQRKNDQQQQKK